MTDYAILSGPLDIQESRTLKSVLTAAKLPFPEPLYHEAMDLTLPTRLLSVGRNGVKMWHDFGLVNVTTAHGDVFTHRSEVVTQPTRYIMPVFHPGSLMQSTLHGGRDAWDHMLADLVWWRLILEGRHEMSKHKPRLCGKCVGQRPAIHRPATHWLQGADGVGLCDDHWRKRAKIKRKARARVNTSSREAQIPGQRAWWTDGMVAK